MSLEDLALSICTNIPHQIKTKFIHSFIQVKMFLCLLFVFVVLADNLVYFSDTSNSYAEPRIRTQFKAEMRTPCERVKEVCAVSRASRSSTVGTFQIFFAVNLASYGAAESRRKGHECLRDERNLQSRNYEWGKSGFRVGGGIGVFARLRSGFELSCAWYGDTQVASGENPRIKRCSLLGIDPNTLKECSSRTRKGKLTACRMRFSFSVCSICFSLTT